VVKYVIASTAEFREAGTEDVWMPAEVPGSVHTDLMAQGRIPDPFVADNELGVQWVAERDWEYRIALPADAALLGQERVFLVCDGLDTLADVAFNGKPLGHVENMFRQYRWDVTGALNEGQNEVHILFHSILQYVLAAQEKEPVIGVSQAIPGSPHVRKAPCQFGWDWGPQLPPMGVWREMRLEGYNTARLDEVHIRQVHTADGVTLKARIRLERWQVSDVEVVLRVTSPDGADSWEEKATLAGSDVEGQMAVRIANPQLWWPNGHGAQPLYEVALLLSAGDDLLDEETLRIGLRKLELRQELDDYGKSFTFVVNDVPLFAKGANWIPADSFPSRISDAHLTHLIRSAADANMNMLRVWGGGFYEEDRFYDLCDRYGILVWQDFIFSCSVYPGDADFVENVRVEAVENIRRLRHHPSLVLWCGNNEMEGGWVGWGWAKRIAQVYKFYYDEMFHRVLPALVAEHDPDRPYWPSSPSSGIPFDDPGGVHAGDTHNWEVWHGGRPFEHYRTHPSRFVSEFGFQSLPPLETIRTYADEQDWNMTSYMMEHHQRNASGNGKIINYMTAHFRLPKDFPSLVYLTQLLQAEAVRTGVEYWRRNRACTSGALYWQLNDCWPVASWASLDYFGRWKALHYAARRFFAPVLLSAEETVYTTYQPEYLFQPKPGPSVTLHLSNDPVLTWHGRVRWSFETLDGEVLESGSEQVAVEGYSAEPVAVLNLEGKVDALNERSVILVYELLKDEERMSLGVLTFTPSKHLALSDPRLAVEVAEGADGFEIAVRAVSLARFVQLSLVGTDEAFGAFSDNFFDVPAGRTVRVTLPAMDGWDAERVRSALQVQSLIDSY
jgi:beta-mannosidase